ncbi:MAG: roadblock/LC7 domain-containing protein [Deinococcus sp.]|uniref:roadblock/LC7 domain-containing protein n=1 Tax=Deinococcus sp. TaxID=47478 RepID=UPI0026DA7BE8|nr:roadblock/LC7 domain-containing protein [Deinococcus sp.]MDO4245640.1 roadblock/LC7 domain-containing protein [Deinococcus sp.]
MPNAVYTMTLQTLAQSVSERGAEALLTAALQERNLSPDEVSAAQMQLVLAGPLGHRLSTILTPERARMELGTLAQRLENEYPKAPTLFTDIGAFTNWDQVEPTVTDWTGTGDFSEEQAGKPEWANDPTPAAQTAPVHAAPVPPRPVAAEADDFGDDDFGDDDFEFDDPEYAAPLQGRQYALARSEEQDALIRDLGRMQGVLGVVVTRANGEILKVRALRDASRLGSVIAATAMLLRQSGLKLLSADLGGQTVCMRPLGEHCVAVIAGPQVNVGRLLAELQQIGEAS